MSNVDLDPRVALAALIEIKTNVLNKDPISLHLGICSCFKFTQAMENSANRLTRYMEQSNICWGNWPEFSNNYNYPVPLINKHGVRWDPVNAYGITGNYWDDSEYGQARMRLLDWLINEFTKVVNQLPEEIYYVR